MRKKNIFVFKLVKKIFSEMKQFFYRIILQIVYLYCSGSNQKKGISSKKSILFLAEFDTYGGTRTYVEKLCALLERHEYLIYFVQNKYNIDKNGRKLITSKRIIHIYYNYSFNTLWNILISIIHLYKIIKEKNIYLTFVSEGSCGYYLPCILFNTQNILIEHTIPMGGLNYYRKKIAQKIKNNTKIICVSDFQRKKVLNNWGSYLNNYCSVILNSGSFNSFVTLKKDFIFSERKKIITVAHFVDYKNPDMWLSIAKKLTQKYNDLEFRWVGDGEKLSLYQDILKTENAIKLLGYCTQKEIKNEYANAFLYLALSKIENLSISAIDALHAEVPVIALNTGGLPEVVESENCGFVVNTEEEVIEKIELLLSDQACYLTMCKNSIDRYNEIFSKEAWEKKIISAIF